MFFFFFNKYIKIILYVDNFTFDNKRLAQVIGFKYYKLI